MRVNSVAKIIEVLDGINAVGKITRRGYTAVWNWKAANKFPARTYVVLEGELRKRGYTAPKSLWGMDNS